MSNILGRFDDIGIGLESVRGTAVAPTYWPAIMDRDFEDNADFISDNSALGVNGETANMTLKKQWAEGSIKAVVGEKSIGVICALLAGASPTSVTTTGETTHTFNQVTNSVLLKTATIARKDANVNLAYVNAALNSIKFNLETGAFFNYDASFLAKKSATASNTVAHASENLFVPKHATIKLATNQAGLGAASAISLKSASISFDKNPEGKEVLGSVDIADVFNKTVKITGSLEVYYTDTTYKNYVFNQTEQALRIGVVNTDVTLANSSNPHLYLDLYRVRFNKWKKKLGLNDIVTETVDFEALVDLSNSSRQFTLELLNGVSSY